MTETYFVVATSGPAALKEMDPDKMIPTSQKAEKILKALAVFGSDWKIYKVTRTAEVVK